MEQLHQIVLETIEFEKQRSSYLLHFAFSAC